MRVIPVWPANAVLLTILFQAPPRLRAWLSMLGFCSLFMLNLAVGDKPMPSLALALCDLFEVFLAIMLLAPRNSIPIPWDKLPLEQVLRVGIIAPACSAFLASSMLTIIEHAAFLPSWGIWFIADALGMLLVIPLSLVINIEDLRRLAHPTKLRETAVVLITVFGVDFFVFGQKTHPLLFSILPVLMLAAFRLNFAGASIAIFMTSCIAISCTRSGLGPLTLIGHTSQSERIFFLQLFLATSAFTTLAVGSILHNRDELQSALTKRVKELAESYERERRIAQTFQEAALDPNLPLVPGLTLAAVYHPGSSESMVGGDWYDAFLLSDGRLALSIGDVSGSGLHAAVAMASIRQSIRTAALISADPASILDAVDGIVRAMRGDQFATAFVAVLDPVRLELTYACAGHPSPFLKKPSGVVEAISQGELPLGLREAGSTRSATMRMEPGSLLVLYTDGLTEFERDPLSGEKKLAAALSKLSAPQQAASELYCSLLGEKLQHDDVAILTVSFSCVSDESLAEKSIAPLQLESLAERR